MSSQFDPGSEPEFIPSKQFSDDLKSVFRPPGRIPPDIDRRITDLARARLSSPVFVRSRRRQLVHKLVAVAGIGVAAAAILLLVWAGPAALRPVTTPAASDSSLAAAPGQVTILDAFALARQIEAGAATDRKWDANNDGTVDRRDVDALAQRAVKLEGGPT
jgi:hypothetical protein